MRIFSRYTLLLSTLSTAITVGCTDINENIGNNFMRDDQETQIKYELFDGETPDGDNIFSFSEFIDEDFDISNLNYGTTGSQYKENFGRRTSGFYSQYTPFYTLDSNSSFGDSPIIHSVLFYLPAAEFSGDTTIVNKYRVYRVLDDDFLSSYKTMTGADAEMIFGNGQLSNTDDFEEIFTFNFPDQENGIYTNTDALFLDYYYGEANELNNGTLVTEAGRDLIDQLMLKSVDGETKIDYTYYSYENHDKFVDLFKGLYVEWVGAEKNGVDITADIAAATTEMGVTYSHLLSSAGFGFTCYKNQTDKETADEDGDTSAITLSAMIFSFYDMYSLYGGKSINYINREAATVVDDSNIYAEALGGKVTEMRLNRSFFEYMESIIKDANEKEHTTYNNIFFNKAAIKGYIPAMINYDLETDINIINEMTYQMNAMPTRIGMYTTYSNSYDSSGKNNSVPIYDYDTVSESFFGTISDYKGYINRSLGCYEMNIHHQMQIMWSKWLKLENRDTITDDELNALNWNRIYIAPEVLGLASVKYASIQGISDKAPLQLEVIYTLRK